jgi:hypothetical protein
MYFQSKELIIFPGKAMEEYVFMVHLSNTGIAAFIGMKNNT